MKVARIVAVVVGLYLVVRAIAEPFLIDMSDPATYRDDWVDPACSVSCWSTAGSVSWQDSPR